MSRFWGDDRAPFNANALPHLSARGVTILELILISTNRLNGSIASALPFLNINKQNPDRAGEIKNLLDKGFSQRFLARR